MRIVAISLALLAVASCGNSGAELIVSVRSDLRPAIEFDGIETALFAGSSTFGVPRTFERGVVPGDDLIAGVSVAEFGGVADGANFIRIRFLDAGRVVLTRNVRLDVRGSLGITVLMSRACVDLTCPAPEGDPLLTECSSGRCVDPSCTAETPERCGTPACSIDDDCSAAVACVSASCTGGGCLFLPDDGSCPPGETCSPTTGCTSPIREGCDVCGGDGTCAESCIGDCQCPAGCDCDITCVGPCRVSCASGSTCRVTGTFTDVICDNATCFVDGDDGTVDCVRSSTCFAACDERLYMDCFNEATCCWEGGACSGRNCINTGGTCGGTMSDGTEVRRCGVGATCPTPDPGCFASP